ncbi:hypothetical protein RB195_016584 [Necator americanus]|uniref:Uncharacterized protein n=1 Tax=Necator americanus TaxID=51031 RepID=A0ABR1C180_NECAM
MRHSLHSLIVLLLIIVSAAAYLGRYSRMDLERESRSAPDFDVQYANNFYRGYGSDSRFGPGPEFNRDRYW